MPLSRTAGFLASGAIFAGLGGVVALTPAGAAVTPTTPVATATTPVSSTPSLDQWTDTAFPLPAVTPAAAALPGTARIVVSPADEELADWTVGPANGGNWRSGIAVIAHGKRLLGTATVPWTVATKPAITTAGQGLVLGTARGAIDTDGLGWATVSPSGAVSKLHTLTTASLASSDAVSLSMNAKGAAVAAWIQGGSAPVLRAALRADASHAFGKPFTVSPARATELSGVSTAIDATGHAVVIYGTRPAGQPATARVVRASIGLASNPSLGDVGVVGPQDGHARTTATFAAGGRLDVAWGSQPAGEDADGPYVVRTASLGRAAGAFTKAVTVDAGADKIAPPAGLQLVNGTGSSTVLAWSGVGKHGTFPVKEAQTNPFGQFGTPRVLAANAKFGGVAAKASGFAVVSMSPYVSADDSDDADPSSNVIASVKLPGGSFMAPDPVTTILRAHSDFSEPLAFDAPAVAISPTAPGYVPRAIVARIVIGADGAASLVLTQRTA